MMRILEFFRRQLLIARVYGIPVRIDYRWFFVLVVLSWITASNINSVVGNILASLFFGILTTLVFFASIFLHELAHAVTARIEGVQVVEIVLHPFGGLTRLRHEPETPRAEFRIAVAGPVASFLLALLFLGMMEITNLLGTSIITSLFFLLSLLNFLLAVFNLFPGYPLDGGRLLRAYLWRRGTDLNEATVLTGRCGQIIAFGLIVFGLFIAFVRGDFFTGLWTGLVGLFLYDAARSIIRQTNDLKKILVRDVMKLPIAVAPESSVLEFVDRILPLYRLVVFPVAENRQLYGILTLEDLKKLPRDVWNKTKIQNVMRPITPDYFVEADTLFVEARTQMRENGIGALGVIDEQGNLVGFLQSKKIKRQN